MKLKPEDIASKLPALVEELANADDADNPELALLHNVSRYNMWDFGVWLEHQPAKVQAAALRARPNRVYELDSRLCYVVGFDKNGQVAVKYPGVKRGVLVDPAKLQDVTETLRAKYQLTY